jgi:hypothetical protein
MPGDAQEEGLAEGKRSWTEVCVLARGVMCLAEIQLPGDQVR